ALATPAPFRRPDEPIDPFFSLAACLPFRWLRTLGFAGDLARGFRVQPPAGRDALRRSPEAVDGVGELADFPGVVADIEHGQPGCVAHPQQPRDQLAADRKSTRLNSSH